MLRKSCGLLRLGLAIRCTIFTLWMITLPKGIEGGIWVHKDRQLFSTCASKKSSNNRSELPSTNLSVWANVNGRIRVQWWPNFSMGQPAERNDGRVAHVLCLTSDGLFLWQPSSGLWKWEMRGVEHSLLTSGPWRGCQYCSAPSPPRKREVGDYDRER